MECSHGIDIDPLSSVNPLMMNESAAVGWPIFIAFATGRPICMQLACWWHRSALDAAAAAHARRQSEREGADSTLHYSKGWSRMLAGESANPALSGWWGFCSGAQHSIWALLWHVKCKPVEGSEAAATPLSCARGRFQEFILVCCGDTFTWDNICQPDALLQILVVAWIVWIQVSKHHSGVWLILKLTSDLFQTTDGSRVKAVQYTSNEHWVKWVIESKGVGLASITPGPPSRMEKL